MTLVHWFDVLLLSIPFVWLMTKFGMRLTSSPEELGYVLLKQKAARLGVDTRRIPEPAWQAIAELSVASARDRALSARAGLGRFSNWQDDLAGTLDDEAVEISKFLKGSPCSRRSAAPHVLTEYRV
jgi:hypothetical protein